MEEMVMGRLFKDRAPDLPEDLLHKAIGELDTRLQSENEASKPAFLDAALESDHCFSDEVQTQIDELRGDVSMREYLCSHWPFAFKFNDDF